MSEQAKVAVREIEQAKNAVSEAVLQVNQADSVAYLTRRQAKKYKSLLEQETTEKERLQARDWRSWSAGRDSPLVTIV